MLGVSDASYFYYLNQSGTYEVEGTDDKKEYEETRVTCHSYLYWIALSVLNCFPKSSKDHLLLIQCYYRRKPKLN
jgi:hypothetical protein